MNEQFPCKQRFSLNKRDNFKMKGYNGHRVAVLCLFAGMNTLLGCKLEGCTQDEAGADMSCHCFKIPSRIPFLFQC